MRTVTVKLPDNMLKAIDTWARILHITRSELIRKAIEHYIHQNTGEKHGQVTRMARIYPQTLDDFKEAVTANCNPTTHMSVTDDATYVYVIPIVTSQHRHYIILLDVDEETVQKALDWLKKQGFKIIRGRVELQPA